MRNGHWILSYPKSVLTDSASLRHAVLYYDGIASILTSPLAEFPCSDEMRMLNDEGQFLPVYPGELIHASEHQALATSLWDEFLNAITSPTFTDTAASGSSSYWSLYPTDMRRDWMAQLRESGIVGPLEENEDSTFLSEPYALLYFSLLAKYMAQLPDYHLTPYTDNPRYHEAVHLRPKRTDSHQGLAVLLDQVLPTPSASARLRDLLTFKRKRPDELLRLRKVCFTFIEALGQTESAEELRDIVEKSRTELALSVTDLERVMRDARIQCTVSSLTALVNVKSPAFLAGMATILTEFYGAADGTAVISLPAKISAVIGIAAVQIAGLLHESRVKAKKAQNDSGVAYLYHARRRGLTARDDKVSGG